MDGLARLFGLLVWWFEKFCVQKGLDIGKFEHQLPIEYNVLKR